MTIPVYKIETYTGAVLDHTIEKEANVYFKEIITDGIGHFSFTVPTKKNGNYKYDDIALNDKVKIWMGYDSVSGNPDFIGKVGKISASLSPYLRVISGLSQGEILLRRFKKNKMYSGTGASTIVTEWATDLSLGTGDITADATAVTLEVQTKSYFDLLRWISDYWASAGSQIKKDFYVDVDNDLVWKARPFRSGASVETLTVGDNILSYQVLRDIDAIKNDIVVYGAPEKHYPSDKDLYTEQDASETCADDGWTINNGTPTLSWSTTKVVGNESLRGQTTATTLFVANSLPGVTSIDCTSWKKNSYKGLHFWVHLNSSASVIADIIMNVRVLSPDTSNYWGAYLNGLGKTRVSAMDQWFEFDLPFVWNADVFTDPVWDIKVGSPDWSNVRGVQWYVNFSGGGTSNLRIDGMYFRNAPFSGTATDATYSQRDLEVTDEKLLSDSDCEKRAETILYMKKDPPVQIVVTTLGNMNILVGDRLSMTIPAENISAANYDVISVEHSISSQGFITKATTLDSANIRQPVTQDSIMLLSDLNRQLKELSIDEKLIR